MQKLVHNPTGAVMSHYMSISIFTTPLGAAISHYMYIGNFTTYTEGHHIIFTSTEPMVDRMAPISDEENAGIYLYSYLCQT